MASTSRCPACNDYVIVPDQLGRDAQVRCPHCEKEFAVGEVGEPGDDAPEIAPVLVQVPTVEEGPFLDIWKDQQPLVDEVPEIDLGSVLRKPASKKASPKREADPAIARPESDEHQEPDKGPLPAEVNSAEAKVPAPQSDSLSDTQESDDLPRIELAEPPDFEVAGRQEEEPAAEEADLPADSDRADELPVIDAEGAGPPLEEQTVEPSDDDRETGATAVTFDRQEESSQQQSEAAVVETQPAADLAELEPSAAKPEEAECETVGVADQPAEAEEERDLLVRCPHCEAESKLTELIVASSGERLTVATLAEALGLVPAGERQAGGPELDVWGKRVDQAPLIDTGQSAVTEHEHLDAGTFNFGRAEQEANGDGSVMAKSRRRRGDKSLVKELVGAVFGAILAVPIAYYLLNLIGGERFDKVPVPLPFCPHTYDHLPSNWPDWWPQWARFSAPPADTEPADFDLPIDDPAAEQAIRRLEEAERELAPRAPPGAKEDSPRAKHPLPKAAKKAAEKVPPKSPGQTGKPEKEPAKKQTE